MKVRSQRESVRDKDRHREKRQTKTDRQTKTARSRGRAKWDFTPSQLRASYHDETNSSKWTSLIIVPNSCQGCFYVLRGEGGMLLNEAGRQKLIRQNSPQQVQHTMLYSDQLQTLWNVGTFGSRGISAEVVWISASSVSPWGGMDRQTQGIHRGRMDGRARANLIHCVVQTNKQADKKSGSHTDRYIIIDKHTD